MRRSVAAAVAAVVAVLVVAAALPYFTTPVFAHAALVRANPANNETLRRPPARIVLNFSEAVEQRLTQIKVTDKDGTRFDDGATTFDPSDPTFVSVGLKDLNPGLYFVKWANVSAVDGHGLSGSYPFVLLNTDGTFPPGASLDASSGATTDSGQLLPQNIDIVLKWLGLLSLATVAGAAFFLIAVLRPAAKFLDDEPFHAATDAGERWVVALAHVLLPLSFLASAFLILVTLNRFEASLSLWSYLTTVRTGEYHGVALILLAVALAGGDLLFLGGSARKRDIGLGVMLLASVGALSTYALISHGATGQGKFWSVTSDLLHILASSTWLGALVMVPPLMRWIRRSLDESSRYLYLANAFDRFSIVAGLSVVIVLASGTFNGLVEVPRASAMVDTTYGKVLIAKLALIVPLLAIAGLNAFILKPKLVSLIDSLYQHGGSGPEGVRLDRSKQLRMLQRVLPATIVIEVALVVAVFAAVSVLSQAATAKGEIAQDKAASSQSTGFKQSATAGDVTIALAVSPNRVGLNNYTLDIQKSDGTAVTTATQVRLRFSYDDVANAVAPSEIILNASSTPGEFRGTGSYFTQPGNWRTEVNIRRSDADDASHIFVLPVARAQATATSTGGAFELPFSVFNWNQVAGAVFALAGAMIIVYRKQLAWLRQPGYRIGITFATVLMLAGAVLAFGVHTHTNAIDPTKGNPVKPTQDSVDRGKTLFQQNCVVCHGIDGRGDGPSSATLSPAPTDFRLHMPLHTDPQFYTFIADGYPGSQMPQFRKAFSETDIWNLINYLRASFSEAPTQ